jgi:hypothetical protein
MIYTALYVMILIRADPLRGQVGGGRAHWGPKKSRYPGLMSPYYVHWSALMTPKKVTPWTACVHFRDSYPIDVSHLSSKFSLSAAVLGIYLYG